MEYQHACPIGHRQMKNKDVPSNKRRVISGGATDRRRDVDRIPGEAWKAIPFNQTDRGDVPVSSVWRFSLLLFLFKSFKGAVGVLADTISHLAIKLFRLREHVFYILQIHFDHHIVNALLFILISVYRPNSIQGGSSKRLRRLLDILLLGRLFKISCRRGA